MVVYLLFDIDYVIGVYDCFACADDRRNAYIESRDIEPQFRNQVDIFKHLVWPHHGS